MLYFYFLLFSKQKKNINSVYLLCIFLVLFFLNKILDLNKNNQKRLTSNISECRKLFNSTDLRTKEMFLMIESVIGIRNTKLLFSSISTTFWLICDRSRCTHKSINYLLKFGTQNFETSQKRNLISKIDSPSSKWTHFLTRSELFILRLLGLYLSIVLLYGILLVQTKFPTLKQFEVDGWPYVWPLWWWSIPRKT